MFDPDEADAFLAHYGVKGMRWGVRKSDQPSARSQARREANAARDKMISDARIRYNTTAKSNLKAAKLQYAKDKQTVGRHEARKALKAVRRENAETARIATKAKSGEERTRAIMAMLVGVPFIRTDDGFYIPTTMYYAEVLR